MTAVRTRDVIVVGAGPAGSALAAQLAARFDVLLLDRWRFPRAKPCGEYASPGVPAALERLGCWPATAALGPARLRGMEIVAPDGGRFAVEYGSDGGGPRLSLTLPRREFDAALLEHARRRGATVQEGTLVLDVLRRGEQVVGVLARAPDGAVRERRARLVVGADGLRSVVARRLGLARPQRWPQRLGLVAHYQEVAWPAPWGEMHVGRRGYCGVAPLGDGRLTVGLVLPAGTRPPPGGLDALFDAALSDYPTLAARLGRGRRAGPVLGVAPLGVGARRVAGAGFLLVGDAAGFFDPFTGEGIFRALRSAELAAAVASDALGRGDLSAGALAPYARRRAAAFRDKEWLVGLVQLFVCQPALLSYAVARLAARPALASVLNRALGDVAPARDALRPGYLAALLRP